MVTGHLRWNTSRAVVSMVLMVAVCRAGTAPALDPLNAVYTVDGEQVALMNGKAERQAAPGSAMKTTIKIVGRPAIGDLNGDGKADAAVFLMVDRGGSGVFFYVAAAIDGNGTGEGPNAVLQGDRIAVRSVEIRNGRIIARYIDRKPSEPFSAKPSVAVTRQFVLAGLVLRETAR